ncbi:hypothetical protein TNIN_141971 [Trichonephila inaurata madagascariensis]|uniref:Uncharacterized protein n=1 Tax=Trichonephila inaurata madagascariensis TaxID=2747483 RepID=A0A8X6IGG9_9ARAC|nr:hypothetical protein TNIN_141971 [Trichonephila inaurata madagascariensis]
MSNLPIDMELEQVTMQRNSSRTPSPQLSTCEQLKYNKAQLAKMETIRRCQQTCVDSLRQMPDHYPEEPFYTRALTELQEIEETMAVAVSDIDSFPPCTTPGCPHHEKNPVNSPTKKILTTPRNNNANNPGKRKDISSFEYPPLRKTARKIVLNHPVNEEINLYPNKYALSQDKNDINPENPGSEVNENNPPPQIRNPNTEPKNSTI